MAARTRAYESPKNVSSPSRLSARAEEEPRGAYAFFESLNRVNKYAIAYRLGEARKPETRERRMRKFLEMLAIASASTNSPPARPLAPQPELGVLPRVQSPSAVPECHPRARSARRPNPGTQPTNLSRRCGMSSFYMVCARHVPRRSSRCPLDAAGPMPAPRLEPQRLRRWRRRLRRLARRPAKCFPADNPWNRDISARPGRSQFRAMVPSCGAGSALHPDFGTVYNGAPNGIPYIVVHSGQAGVPVTFDYADESDPGPYPIPPTRRSRAAPHRPATATCSSSTWTPGSSTSSTTRIPSGTRLDGRLRRGLRPVQRAAPDGLDLGRCCRAARSFRASCATTRSRRRRDRPRAAHHLPQHSQGLRRRPRATTRAATRAPRSRRWARASA